MGLCEKHMFFSLITLCEATVLFFDLLVPSSPDILTGRNLPFCTHSTYNRFSAFREDCKDIFGGRWEGWLSFHMFLMERGT